MVLTVLVLNLNSNSDRPVPPWMKVVVFRYLSPLFCKGHYVSSSDDADDVTPVSAGALSTRSTAERLANYNCCNDLIADASLMSVSDATSANNCTDLVPNGNCSQDECANASTHLVTSETTTSFATSLTPLLRGDGKCAGRSVSWSESNNDVTASHGDTHLQNLAVPSNSQTAKRKSKHERLRALSPQKLERDVRADERMMTSQLASAVEPQERRKEEDFSKEWTRLAEVVDRFFFCVFLIAMMIMSLLLFHPLVKDYTQPRSH